MSSAFRVNNSEEFDDISANEVVFSLENRLQLGSQTNSGATSYSITFPRAFTAQPKIFLSTQRSDAAFAFWPNLLSSSTTGFSYKLISADIASNDITVGTDAHLLMWMAHQ